MQEQHPSDKQRRTRGSSSSSSKGSGSSSRGSKGGGSAGGVQYELDADLFS